jgi:hypothetical protein
MSRYKGRASAKSLTRDFPYAVETVVPPGCFGSTMDRMTSSTALRGIRAMSGPGRRVDECALGCSRMPLPRKPSGEFLRYFGKMIVYLPASRH